MRPTPRLAMAWDESPSSRSAPSRIWPPSARVSPLITLKSVVLPAPFGPMRPVIEPGATESVQSASAVTPPKRLLMPVTLSSSGVVRSPVSNRRQSYVSLRGPATRAGLLAPRPGAWPRGRAVRDTSLRGLCGSRRSDIVGTGTWAIGAQPSRSRPIERDSDPGSVARQASTRGRRCAGRGFRPHVRTGSAWRQSPVIRFIAQRRIQGGATAYNCSSSALASRRSAVSKPSVNHP